MTDSTLLEQNKPVLISRLIRTGNTTNDVDLTKHLYRFLEASGNIRLKRRAVNDCTSFWERALVS